MLSCIRYSNEISSPSIWETHALHEMCKMTVIIIIMCRIKIVWPMGACETAGITLSHSPSIIVIAIIIFWRAFCRSEKRFRRIIRHCRCDCIVSAFDVYVRNNVTCGKSGALFSHDSNFVALIYSTKNMKNKYIIIIKKKNLQFIRMFVRHIDCANFHLYLVRISCS